MDVLDGPSAGPAQGVPASAGPSPEQKVLDSALGILRAYGYNAMAEMAKRKTLETRAARTVVVVGEVKRGKSSLVNAMLEQPDASPVDVDVTTSASLHLVPESEQNPRGWVDLCFPGEVRRVPGSELAEWVTQRGRFVADTTIESLPTRAMVPVQRNTFDGAVVVDTPGVGGLNATHAQLAVGSAQQACVLVIVADAGAPLTAPEMDFIRKTAATVESIIVVVTKTDKNVRRWRAIVDEDRRLLQQHLQRQIPVVGVSSVRALAACEFPAGPKREGYLATSGMTALRDMIRLRLDMGESLAMIDGMRTTMEGLRSIHGKIRTEMQVIRDGAKAMPELTQERDHLQQLKDEASQWELHMGRDMTFARQAALEHLDKQLEEIKEKWTQRINSSGMAVLRKNPQVFTAEIEADLMRALCSTIDLYVRGMHRIVGQWFQSPEHWAEIYRMIMASLGPRPQTLNKAEVTSKKKDLFDPTMLSMGMGGVSMAGAVASQVGLGVVTGGIGLAFGAVWLGVNLGYKAMRAGKNNLLTWLRETIGLTKTTAARMLETAMTTTRTEIVLRRRNDLRHRTEEVARRLTEAQEAQKRDTAEREKALTNQAKNERIVTANITELEKAIARLAVPQPVGAPS